MLCGCFIVAFGCPQSDALLVARSSATVSSRAVSRSHFTALKNYPDNKFSEALHGRPVRAANLAKVRGEEAEVQRRSYHSSCIVLSKKSPQGAILSSDVKETSVRIQSYTTLLHVKSAASAT